MVAKQLRTIRQQFGLTQKEVAGVLGIDRTTYTYYETGLTSPPLETLYKLSKMYHVTVGYLMGVEINYFDPGETKIAAKKNSDAQLRLEAMSRDEKELLLCYRVLNSEAKEKVLEQLHLMALKTEDI